MNKRTKIYVLVLIWAAILLQLFINSSIDREKKMVEQVMSEDISNLSEGTVKAYAFYGNEELSEGIRESMAKNLAKELGVTSGYSIISKKDGVANSETTTLSKYGEQADTVIKIITLRTMDKYEQESIEDYIMVEINLKGSNAYKDELTIVSVKLSDLSNVNAIVIPRFEIGGRWFDDIVDNNARRQ